MVYFGCMDPIDDILDRGVANIISSKEDLKKKLLGEKPLKIYMGIDPTATHIHLGHAFPLRKLQKLSEMGHEVTFLIGDFTALIGDTSDKDTERPVLTTEEIHENFQTYKKQAEKILDFSKIQVVYNSQWLKKLTFEEIIKLCQHFSVGDFISRELIRKRLDDGKRVGLHEVLYPVMQGYDSYFLNTDLQIGGTDQTFNMQAGRSLQKELRKKDSFVLTTEFLMGTDGRKMSKSWGNAIWLDDNPSEMYAKIMSINDDLIVDYYMLGTNVPVEQVMHIKENLATSEHPMTIKKALAKTIVTELHSTEDAEKALLAFESTVQNHEIPEEIEEFPWTTGGLIVDLLARSEIAMSKSEARRLIEQGGVTIDGETINSITAPFAGIDGSIVKVGKRRYLKIKLNG